MNFKSLFAKKPTEPALPATEARAQHYAFAHRVMPQVAHQFGANTVLLLDDPNAAPGFLQRRWDDAAQGATGAGLVTTGNTSARIHQNNGRLAAVITLPQPIACPEAYFIAIICDIPPQPPADKSEESLDAYREMLAQMPIEYFTLEYGFTLDTPRTVLCQWTSEGAHLNLGDGPPPDEAAFVAAVFGRGE